MEQRLSDYVDGALSARETWEVEKHLAACPECAAAAQQMQSAVRLLRNTERFEVGDDFMARLHARLDSLDPAPSRSVGPLNALRSGLAAIGERLSPRHLPGLSLGVGVAGLAVVLVVAPSLWMHSGKTPTATHPTTLSLQIQQTLERQVAASASDPLSDAAAERLTAHTGLSEEVASGSID